MTLGIKPSINIGTTAYVRRGFGSGFLLFHWKNLKQMPSSDSRKKDVGRYRKTLEEEEVVVVVV